MQLLTRWRDAAGERVRIALNLKRLRYDRVSVADPPPGACAALDPPGPLPALRVGDQVIARSTAILEYLEETWPSPTLLPGDPVTRAQARSFAAGIAGDLHPLNDDPVRRYLRDSLGASDPALRDWYGHWVRVTLTGLEAMLLARRPAPFCFGDEPGWADLHLVPQMADARRFGCDLSPYPRLAAIDAACTALPAFRDAPPDVPPTAN